MPHVADHLLLRPTRPSLTLILQPPPPTPPASDPEQRAATSLSSAALVARVGALAAVLRLLDVRLGDVVALGARPTDLACLLTSLFAASAVGAAFAPVNSRWSVEEVAATLARGGGVRVLLLAPEAPLARALRPGAAGGDEREHERVCAAAAHVLHLGPEQQVLDKHLAGTPSEARWLRTLGQHPAQVAVICFTSGTTGASKGALLSHTALLTQSLNKITTLQYTPSDVYLNVAPLFHIGGISYALAATLAGSTHVALSQESFVPADLVQAVTTFRVTTFIAAPVLLEGLMAASHCAAPHALVRLLALGAGGADPALLRRAATTFPNARVITAYGMTEACSSIAMDEPARSDTRAQSGHSAGACVGRACPHAEIAILREDDQFAHEGEEGEVLVRGQHMMNSYWNDPEETTRAMFRDSWFRTGDLGLLDSSGQLWLRGRKKDVIRTGGENVHASEVESVLIRHPGIKAAGVVGVPDKALGELVAALIVLYSKWSWSEEESTVQLSNVLTPSRVREHCVMGGLSRYKLPRFVAAQADPLPADPAMGKVSKNAIREHLTGLRGGWGQGSSSSDKRRSRL